MRLLCLMLAATSASAAGMDIDAPGFWTKGYAISQSYCELSLTLASPRAEKLVKASAPCEFKARVGGIQSECRLPNEEAKRIAAELRRIGTLTAYSQACDAAPEFPELYYKRDNLKREWAELGINDAEGISGLMATQLSTLDWLISTHEAARVAELTIVISTTGPSAPHRGSANSHPARVVTKIANKARPWFNPDDTIPPEIAWERRSRAVCEQIEKVGIAYENVAGPEDAARLAALHRLGPAYSDPSCSLVHDAVIGAVIFSVLPEAHIRKIIMELPGFQSWIVSSFDGDGILPDDIRYDRLSAELLAHKEALSRAPHVRGLVAAEIERLRENAQRVRALRKGRLLVFQFR